ncbi:MAG: TetR/AcrR family transcriptional regulator [Inquilinus sp.]|nr:TetR/AcrR family transcriptional regulator [Inquilinus sp.]
MRRRLPPAERRRSILDGAAAFFAERGFDGPTRDLAERLGVTQALLYRYFPSKEALIDAVFEAVYADNWDPAWTTALADRGVDLAERLNAFYRAYLGRGSATTARLFMRANLDGLGYAKRYSVPLTDRVLRPVLAELRHAAGLPAPEAVPIDYQEREIAMALHGALVFLSIRKNIYGTPLPDDLAEPIAGIVRLFLPGALAALQRLHGDGATDRLPLLDPASRR